MEGMISVDLAQRLRDAGLRWTPAAGDRFVIPGVDMDEQVFTLSDMTIEVHEFPTGPVLGFNGTVEWALDSIDQGRALWLPSEAQLRERLGTAFRRLESAGATYRVVLEVSGRTVTAQDPDPAEAYGLALLHLATGQVRPGVSAETARL